MSDAEAPESSIILYQTEDGQTRVQCRFESGTIWLTQALISELFQVTPQNVTLHLKAIYEEGELDEGATCKDYLQVRSEGRRQVSRSLRHYNLPAILTSSAFAPEFAPIPDNPVQTVSFPAISTIGPPDRGHLHQSPQVITPSMQKTR